MCIIIVANKNKKIPNEYIKLASELNRAGFGISASVNNRLFVYKSISTNSDDIIKLYNSIRQIATGDIVLHFRLATHGGISDKLCHPFHVNKDLVMFHNGVMRDSVSGYNGYDKNESDTKAFVNNVLKNFKKGFQNNKTIMNMISTSVGEYNRLCFLDNTGRTNYTSSDKWVEYNGILYSNPDIFYEGDNYRYINPATMEYITEDCYDDYCDSEYYDEYIEYKDNIDYYKDYEELDTAF
nr:MAG TPA: YafJ [Caudoviricetes sp.]